MNKPTWIGRTIGGRYKIEELLGQGGMSAVYKATDPNLKRVVAVKLIHEHLSVDPDFVRRFESEASAVASLRHPNIVQVYDFDSDDDTHYMVLEFVPGETLEDRIRRLAGNDRKLSLEDALKFTLNICDAMSYAHQRGIVHRDIKPANIMLDVLGQAILMDFGIVKIMGGDSHTSTGAVVGTARYMSPEIIRGEPADNRSDIYSLGVVLYEMLSARLPFVADSAMTLMMMHLNDPVPDVREFRGDVHPEIVSILSKCLTKDRDERYQSAAEFSIDLKRALAYIGGQVTSVGLKKGTSKPEAVSTRLEPLPLSQTPATQVEPQPIGQTYVEPAPISTSSVRTQPMPRPPAISTAQKNKSSGSNRLIWLIGGGIVVLMCVAVLFVAGNVILNLGGTQQSGESTQTLSISVTDTNPATQEILPVASETSAPIEIPTETPLPTETAIPFTPTPETPFVLITGIRLDGQTYVVDYEVNNFPSSPSLHVHMFFNTVPPESAGSPASGPWKLTWGAYGNPPFTQYGPAQRPSGATQMCALVANPNHSIILRSGNCVDLPE